MELLQLKYFVALAHQGHLTNTAKKMMVTPSAVSISIARLEDELGVKLFDRVGRNIRLNQFGQEFLNYAEAALNSLQDAELRIHELKRGAEASLTLGVWNPQVWQGPIQAFHAVHPEIKINQVTYDPVSSQMELSQSNIELIITSPDSFNDPNWAGAHLFNDRILLAVPPQHRFASRQSIDLYETRDELFVSTSMDTFSKRCYELCREAGFTMKAPVKCDYTLRPKIMESENMLCLITYHGALTGNYSEARLVKIANPSDIRPESIYWRKTRYVSESVRMARDFFIEYYKGFDPLQNGIS